MKEHARRIISVEGTVDFSDRRGRIFVLSWEKPQ